MDIEIEKKYKLNMSLDELIKNEQLSVVSVTVIEQTYLAFDVDQEIRIRKINPITPQGNPIYTHTFKSGQGLQRKEVEYEIHASIYEQLLAQGNYNPLIKQRTTARWKELTVEIDRYEQIDLAVVEVEFNSIEEAEQFTPPHWFGAEIPPGEQYSNKKIWLELQQP